jgi:Zn-dependent protease
MILQNLDLLTSDPVVFIQLLFITAVSLIIAITLHEFSHAYVAYRLGDDTARKKGRVSLNPLVHLDPIGTLLLFIAGFGWGKPVPVNTSFLRPPVRWSMAAVSVSGVFINFLTAMLVALPVRLGLSGNETVMTLLVYTVQINIVLAIFNLIPIPPLDGFNIISSILPSSVMTPLAPAIRYTPFVLLAVIVIDNLFPTNIFGTLIGGPVNSITGALLGLW